MIENSGRNMEIRNFTKKYKNFSLSIDQLHIDERTITAIVGNSGGGKSTFIRAIAKLETYSGEIEFNNKPITEDIYAYMNQKRVLFNHLTIKENLALSNIYLDENSELLRSLNLNYSILEHYPFEVSGGQAQRIDFLRTIYNNKKLLLLDEPFSALDSQTKDDIYGLLQELKTKYGLTILLVTHDILEAPLIADKIVVLQNGNITFSGRIEDFVTKENNVDFISKEKMDILRRLYD